MSLTVEVEGISYSLLEPPDVSSEIVISKKQDIEGSIVLHEFAQELTNLTCLIQFSYFGIAENGDIEDRVQDLMTRITGLCEKWSFLMRRYVAESNRAIECMKIIYKYVCEGNESTAKEMISEKDFEISNGIIVETNQMQEQLDEEIKFINELQAEFRKAKKRVNAKKTSIKELEELVSHRMEVESKLKEVEEKLSLDLENAKHNSEEKRRKFSEEANAKVAKIKEDQVKKLFELDEQIKSKQLTKREKEDRLTEIQRNLTRIETEYTRAFQFRTAFFNVFSSRFNRDKQEREKQIVRFYQEKFETEKEITNCQDEIQALNRRKETCTNGADENIQAIETQSALQIKLETKNEGIEIDKINSSGTKSIDLIKKELEKTNKEISDYQMKEKDHIKVERKLIELAKQLNQCRDKEQEEDVALECLSYALKSLNHLQSIMRQASMFWRNAHTSIKRITKDDESLSKRFKKASSGISIKDNEPLKTESMHYYAKWTAFREMCQNAQKSFMTVQEKLHKTSNINFTKEEAIQTALQLMENV